jgi:hypothetical protein
MKTTLEIPQELFREAKSTAAKKGITLKKLFTEALEEKLRPGETQQPKAPLKFYGCLSELHEDNKMILKEIEREFGQIDRSEWT